MQKNEEMSFVQALNPKHCFEALSGHWTRDSWVVLN